MDYEIVIPVLISFAISAILGPIVIPFLKRLKVGQTERKELESHLKKNGTPTMGGLMILASIIITSLFYVKDYPRIIPILFMTVGFGVIGFLDDYLKVVLRRSDGLLPWQKMILQFIVTTVFAVYMVRYSEIELTMLIPFSGGKYLNIGWLAIPLLYFAVIGTVNGVNFTDGVDGLVSSVTIMVATFFSVVAIGTNAGIAPITCAVAGALLAGLVCHSAVVDLFDLGICLAELEQGSGVAEDHHDLLVQLLHLGHLGDGFVHREDVHPDTGGLAQQQGGLFHLVVGGVIVHHDDALCAHMAGPREYHLTVQQAVVQTY